MWVVSEEVVVTVRVFDAHLHIIDPRFPLVPNQGYVPDAFTVDDYMARTGELGARAFEVAGGAVVSGSFQKFDQTYLVDALERLGPGFVGVTQVPVEVSDAEVLRLHEAGVRAVRFNVARGGSAGLPDMDRLARRVFDLAGWHAEFYIDARSLDGDLGQKIAALPKASVDHLGMHRDGLPHLLRLVESGVMVKATGFGRVELDPAEVVTAIVNVNPRALMVGTDLPSTRAQRPFTVTDFDLLCDTLDASQLDDVFWRNAYEFYGLRGFQGGG